MLQQVAQQQLAGSQLAFFAVEGLPVAVEAPQERSTSAQAASAPVADVPLLLPEELMQVRLDAPEQELPEALPLV